MSVFDDIKQSLIKDFKFSISDYKKSKKWKEYLLGKKFSHCSTCFQRNNKIYLYTDVNIPKLPEHENCGCYLTWLNAISIGNATKKGSNGADYYLYNYNILPNYYITKEKAKKLGWKPWLGNLNNIAPGKMIGGNIFSNRSKKLPDAPGRIWYECDIDYEGGYRNKYRIIYSNDGLIFKTENHYSKFIAVE